MPHTNPNDGLFYEFHGSGEPVFFISGFGGLGSFWKQQMRHFSERFNVLTFDQRGTGASARTPDGYSLEQMTRDARQVMDAADIGRAIIVGHSTGGAVAQALAAEHPERVRALVLSSTWCAPGNYFRRGFEFRRSLLEHGALDLFHQAGVFFRYPPEYAEAHDAAFDRQERIDPDITIQRINAILNADLSAKIDRIAHPTLVVATRDDLIVPQYMSDEVARRIKGSRYVVFEQGGHFLPNTRHEQYNVTLAGFFDSVMPGAKSR